ncbi:MAG: DMT family transporter [Deltaproteobacteria bacterium]|nr:DMT family transporter [Deltaproteobacteria bacterium]
MQTLVSNNLSRKQALVALFTASLLWSSGGLLIKIVEWNPMAIAGARSLIAAATLLLLCGVPRSCWSKLHVATALAYASTVVLFVLANKYTTAANAILLQYTAPIYVIIFGPRVLNEKNSWQDFVLLGLILSGMTLFFLDELSPGHMLGNVMAILSGVSFGMMTVLLRLQKEADPIQSVMLGNLMAGAAGVPFMFDEPLSGSALSGLLVLGVFQLAMSYYLYTKAIKVVRAFDAILITTLEPILNPVWVFLVTSESPGPWAIIGGSIVIAAVTAKGLLALGKRRPAYHSSQPSGI